MKASTRVAQALVVPFALDSHLGISQAQILLVMCEFTLALRGAFDVRIAGHQFDVVRIAIEADPFELQFAPDFLVRVLRLKVERDPDAEWLSGELFAEDSRFIVDYEVPLRITMELDVNGSQETATFRTPLNLHGIIDGTAITFSGGFVFQLEGYSDEAMKPKLGTCRVLMSASSGMQFQIEKAETALTFASYKQAVQLKGTFTVGLDGLDVHVLALSLESTPYEIPGFVSIEAIKLALDSTRSHIPIRFTYATEGGYDIHGAVQARLSASLRLAGFTSQPLNAALTLNMSGAVSLTGQLQLEMHGPILVHIGDGEIVLAMQSEIVAEMLEGAVTGSRDSAQRRLYEAMQSEPTIARLVEESTHPSLVVRWMVAMALKPYLVAASEEGEKLLLILSADQASDVRAAALRVIREAKFASGAPGARDRFHVESTDDVRLEAMLTLAALPGTEWRDVCIEALHDESSVLRSQAAQIIAERAEDVAALLNGVLGDTDPFVRLCAAAGILAHDSAHQASVDTVIDLLAKSRDMCVLMIGCIALGQSRSAAARPVVTKLHKTTHDPFVRYAAEYALKKLNGEGREYANA